MKENDGAAAREVSYIVAHEVTRAAGHAVATAHVADLSLGAATYAIRAVPKASSDPDAEAAGDRVRQWQAGPPYLKQESLGEAC